jgi:hypothetical protein
MAANKTVRIICWIRQIDRCPPDLVLASGGKSEALIDSLVNHQP